MIHFLRQQHLKEDFPPKISCEATKKSTEHTEDTDILSTEDTFFLVAPLEILEEIFNKNMACGQK